jgi:hypothetical protein
LRSREFDSPIHPGGRNPHPELSHRVLQLLINENFSNHILKRLRRGEDFGGKLEDVTYEEFEKQWKRVKENHPPSKRWNEKKKF